MTTPVAVGEVVARSAALEKGGLFVVLLVVLYMGYNIFQTTSEADKNDQKLILTQLTTIAQQQLTMQQSLTNTQASVQASQDATRDVLRKMEQIENTMLRYVYYNDANGTLVIRTPDAVGGSEIKLKTEPKGAR